MKTIYIVTSGCYEDKHVSGAYSTLELAKKAIRDEINGLILAGSVRDPKYMENDYNVTAWYIDGAIDDASSFWKVTYFPEIDQFHAQPWQVGNDWFQANVVRMPKTASGTVDYYECYLYAPDRASAIEIANEKVAQAIAKG